jgi:chromosome segregation ATPase
MKTASTAFLAVLVISSLGIWGCAQQKSGAQANKIRDLEARYTKLEEDYRALLSANESTRKRVAQMELQRADLLQQVEDLKVVAQEREDLKQRLNTRTMERDTAQAQLMQFSKDLTDLAQRVETAAATGVGSTLTALPASRKTH